MWTIQGYEAFEKAQGHGRRLPTATASHDNHKQSSAEGGSAMEDYLFLCRTGLDVQHRVTQIEINMVEMLFL